ncbi:MAG TPA: SBBP repeat-containing protein [Blastocatellia bacterium]|nr:SBBP repeat-containing protein [Blastocatellia bacterium]
MNNRKIYTAITTAGVLAFSLLGAFFFFKPFHAVSESTPTTAKPVQASKAEVEAAYGKLPLSFEANLGQTDDHVNFLSRGHGYGLYLTATETVLKLRNESSVLRMKFLGANPRPKVAGVDQLPGKTNYFIGSDPRKWRKDIPTYAKVKYEAVYPGVDVVYYGAQGRELEYDFIVAPGADPKAIKLSFEGADKLELNDQGDLVLQLAGKPIHLRKPVVYQEKNGVRQEIASNYAPAGAREVAIDIAAYDASRPLVIDPVLAYSTYLGGSGQDAGLEIAVNAHGSAFVTGLTTSLDFPPAPAAPRLGSGGGYDAFVVKLNAAGSAFVYSTYLGGSDDENYHGGVSYSGIAIDENDQAYVTGLTKSKDFPTTAGVYSTDINGYSDAYVSKLNAAGNALVYSTFLGGKGFDGGQAIAVDQFGQAYVTGQDESGDLPLNGFQPIHSAGCSSGYKDGFVAKLNITGSSLVYSSYLGGSSCNLGWGIAVDSAQNAYVMGETVAPNFPVTANAVDPTFNGVSDIFITKMNTTIAGPASLSYSTFLGGNGEERVGYSGGIAVDPGGRFVYVTGLTPSADFPIKNADQPILNGPYDAFITKLDTTKLYDPMLPTKDQPQIVYSTYLGGGGGEFGAGIAVDINGNAYVAGSSGGTFPSTPGMPTCTDPGAFVAKLNAAGSIKYAACLSGAGQDSGLDVAVDPAGSAYVTGFSESANFPLVNPLQPVFAGGGTPPSDGFVTKLSEGLDHFKCYDVRLQQHFQPFDVRLRDQFEEHDVRVLRPTTLCNPAIKCIGQDCTPILNNDAHLVCYETADAEGTPQFQLREVIVSNQFGKEQRLTVWRRKNMLCAPSLKAHVGH